MPGDIHQVRAAYAALLASLRKTAGAPGCTGDLLRDTCQLVLGHAGHHARLPVVTQDRAGLQKLAHAADADLRAVALDMAGSHACAEPLLIFAQDDGRPLALLPRARGTHIVDLTQARRFKAGARRAPRLQATAWAFDLRLPAAPLSWPALLRWALAHSAADLAIAMVAAISGGLAPLALPLAGALLLYTLGSTAWLAWDALPVAAMAAWLLAASAGQAVAVLAAWRVGQAAGVHLQKALLDRLLRWPAACRRRQPGASLAAPLLAIAEACAHGAQQLVQVAAAGASLVFAVVGLCWLDLRLAGFACLGITAPACLAWMLRRAFRLVWATRDDRALAYATGATYAGETSATLLATLQDLLRGRASIWQAGAAARAQAQALHALAAALQEGHEQHRAQCLHAVLHASAFPLGLALLLWAGLADLPPWRALALTGLFLTALSSAATLQRMLDGLRASAPLREVICHWLALAPSAADGSDAPPARQGALVIQSVGFRYRKGEAAVLHDCTLTVRAGECLALTGPSGSGKSTLLRLLMGLEQPQAGAIHLDGRDLSGVGAQALRAQVGGLLQDAALGSGDVFAILAAGRPLTPADAWHALRRAGLAETVRALPLGLATPIVDDGAALSRSQRQRLLLARALAQAPAVLLLDEVGVTLAPDAWHASAQRPPTRIVVTHSLATLRQADRIAWLDEGRVLELGTWDELITLDGRFAGQVRRQQQGQA